MSRSLQIWFTLVLIYGLANADDTQNATGRYRIAFATYIGGGEFEDLREIIRLRDGSLLVGGQTASPDFPVTSGVTGPRYRGEPAGFGHPGRFGGDAALARLSREGDGIAAATYFGGSKQERDIYGMAIDRDGNLVITTTTRSRDIPVTPGAFQRHFGGETDIVVAKLSPDFKRLLWCTYIGGRDDETPRGGLAIDRDGDVYVVGSSRSRDFPTTPGVLQPRVAGGNDAVIVKLRSDGSGIVWSTFLGGSASDVILGVRIDPAGNVYLTGHTESVDFPVTQGAAQPRHGGESDAFLAKLASDGSRLVYATYLGGRENEFSEHRQALLDDGSQVLTGLSSSPDFPATNGAFQSTLPGKRAGFVAKLSPDGRRFVFATFLGGSKEGALFMPTTDPAGNIYLAGQTASADFPVTSHALRQNYGGAGDGVFAILSPDGSKLLYGSYLGGAGRDLFRSLTLGENGAVYLVGSTASDDIPITPGALQTNRSGGYDGYVVKLALNE